MDDKIDQKILEALRSFLRAQSEALATGIKNKSEPDPVVLQAFRRAFYEGGLDAVDHLIITLNQGIKSAGGTAGLGEGAGLEHADGDHPAFLHIFFTDFITGKVLARKSISLQAAMAPPPE